MPKWRRLKEGDKVYLSVVYKSYGKHYGGYYIAFPEVGELYISLYGLGNPEAVEKEEVKEGSDETEE